MCACHCYFKVPLVSSFDSWKCLFRLLLFLFFVLVLFLCFFCFFLNVQIFTHFSVFFFLQQFLEFFFCVLFLYRSKVSFKFIHSICIFSSWFLDVYFIYSFNWQGFFVPFSRLVAKIKSLPTSRQILFLATPVFILFSHD